MNKQLPIADQLEFLKFLRQVEQTNYEINITALGTQTIQQTLRNEIRRQGVAALKHDLELLYGDEFDIVETKEGIIVVAENEPGDFTFSWEIKNVIKALDYDPFVEADKYDTDLAVSKEKKMLREAEKASKAKTLAEKRQRKLEEIEKRKRQNELINKALADNFNGEQEDENKE